MRVLLITGEFPPMQGGVGDFTNEIAKGMAAAGAEVSVLTSRRAAATPRSTSVPGPFTILPVVDHWGWSSLRVIGRCVRDLAPALVSIQYQTGAYQMHPAIDFLPRYLARLTPNPKPPHVSPLPQGGERERRGLRVVTTFHDLLPPYLFPKAGPVRDWVTRELARASDTAVATNVADYGRLTAWGVEQVALIPIGSNITTTLPPGYDRAAWRAQLGVSPGELLLCHFGFVNAQKGCDSLLRALAEIPTAKLLMIGGATGASDPTNVAYHAHIRALITEQGLTGRVLWTGYTPAEIVTANMRAADLCVLPYRQGASFAHGTLMAALAHGLPIVTTRRPRTPAVTRAPAAPELDDAENALLVPPDNPDALAQTIRRAAGDSALCARIAAGALELARHFDWDTIVEQYLALGREIAG